MKGIAKIIFKLESLKNKIYIKSLKKEFKSCGDNVYFATAPHISGQKRVSLGNNIYIGPYATIYCTRADFTVEDSVTIGPHFSVITGDHRTDIIGKHIHDITDKEKKPENDAPVKIESGVWCGANVTVLKGVTVSKGSVIAAGSVVTKSTVPYGIYGGVPAKLIKMRFTPEEIEEHERLLKENS